MKKKTVGLITVICIIIELLSIMVASAYYDSPITSCSSGIRDNGLGGIYIDINSAPFTTFSHIPVKNKYYAYTQYGCAWYASARVNQLTNKGNTIWSANSWWNNCESYGFTRSSTPVEGSIICATNSSGGEHVAILEKIVGSTAYISEGGYESAGASYGYCLIRTVDVSNIKSQYASADFGGYTNFLGYVCFGGTIRTPVDVGTDYYAYIFNSPAWKTVELGSSNNVQLMTEKWTANQRWFVHRNTDGSYTFKNADNNRCLDVANAGNANGTNVQTADYNGSDAQKWNIYAVGDKYVFSPKCAPGKVLDLYSGNTADGTNVQIYDENDTDAQFFTVYRVNPDIPVPVIKSNATNYKTDGTVSITWDKTGYTDHYTYYLAEYPKGYAYTTNTKNGTVTSPSVSFSGLTSGDYSCFVHSVSHLGTQGGQSNWATFKVYEDDYIPTKTVVKDNHIYALYDYDMSWTFANELCADFGGHLVTITSADEESLVENLINSGSKEAYWLGGTDITDFGKLTSTDKDYHWTTGEAFTYSNWKSGEPSATGENGTKEHFAEIRKSYGNKWNDVNNISKNSKGFILEIEIDDYAPIKTDTYNGHQYMLFDKNTTWSEAKVFCEQIGGHLVTIESSTENDFVKNFLKSGERAWYYIGGQKDNGTWKWYNGGTATTISWADNASAWTGTNLMMYKSTGNCIGVDNAYYPESDISNMGFVCEIESTPTPTTKPTVSPTQKPTTQPTETPVPTTKPTTSPTNSPVPTKESVYPSFILTKYDSYADILNDSDTQNEGTVIIADYQNGVLISLSTAKITFMANEKRTFMFNSTGNEHKILVWNDLNSMIPMTK